MGGRRTKQEEDGRMSVPGLCQWDERETEVTDQEAINGDILGYRINALRIIVGHKPLLDDKE